MPDVRDLVARLEQLEQRVAALEGAPRPAARAPRAGTTRSEDALTTSGWTRVYEVASIEVEETWIEIHEPSARPQLQRLIRQVVEAEGPVTDRLVLDRIRRAWGLKRAGGRVQDAFEQALRQLLARGLVERDGDALVAPRTQLELVRIPGDDEATRRGAEDVPLVELARAVVEGARRIGPVAVDDLTMQVAKAFGWTRRGGAIQERLDAAVALARETGALDLANGQASTR
ncbi:MAG: superfamily and helicase protein [Thermoleophilia bacterium]|nr:superfamily and helicase protein [Thermoleophilia bacterium]